MYLPNAPFSGLPSSQTIKVTHLDKIPIRFFLDKKSQSFQLKFNKLNGQKNYSKIEFDFENNLIFIECQPEPPSTFPKIFSISFPPEFEARKESISSEHFDWEATSTQIVISYKCPPQVIVIDENFQPPPKPNVITIDDAEEIFPKSKGIKIINENDIAEIENALQIRYMDRDSKKRYQNRLRNVMKTVGDEFAHSISLKKGQIKKLAHQLIEKNFDSYDKAQENGYSFDVSSNKLYINNDLPDLHQNLDDPNEFNEIKDVNTMDAALQDLDEAVRFPKKKKEKNIVDVMRLQKNERLWNEYLEQNGADERELGLEDENELLEENYEIKKKNSVYIVNESKYKIAKNGDRQKFRIDEEPSNDGIRKKFRGNGNIEEKSNFYNQNRKEETYAINENKFKKLMSLNFRNGEEEENGNFNGEKFRRLANNNINNNNQSFRKNNNEDEEEQKFHFNGRLLSQLLNNNNNNNANNHSNNISNNKFRNNGDEDEPKIKQNMKRKRNTFLNFDEDEGEQYL